MYTYAAIYADTLKKEILIPTDHADQTKVKWINSVNALYDLLLWLYSFF